MTKRQIEYDDNGDVIRNMTNRSSISSSTYSSRDYGTSFSENTGRIMGASTTVSSSGVGGGTHYAAGSEKSQPKMAFRNDGIEYWGSAHSNLDDANLCSEDLLINGYGTPYVSKPFVRSAPSWLNLIGTTGAEPHQLLLDWKDFSPPPRSINIDFWESIVAQAKAEGIRRIVVCCGAGLGRTGTGLAALALASGYNDDPEDAINYIRSGYNSRAIETKAQEFYVWCLVKPAGKFPAGGIPRNYANAPKSSYQLTLESSLEDADSSMESWSNWTRNNTKK